MQLTISADDDRVVSVDMDGEDTVSTLKAILEAETGVASSAQRLRAGGKELIDSSSLSASGVKDGDLIVLERAGGQNSSLAHPANGIAGGNPMAMLPDGSPADPTAMMQYIRSNREMMGQLAASASPLHSLVEANNTAGFAAAMREMHAAGQAQRAAAAQDEIDMLNADPFDPEVQAKIAERIRQEQVEHNYTQAMEHNPEVFVQVDMLYVTLEVNGHQMKAFIDSGAQMTIMGAGTAERLGLMRLIDRRFAGVAKGVGTGKILGRVHTAPMRVGDQFLACSVTIMEGDDMQFLFGLDMLRRHQCQIDLRANVLRFTNLDIALPFLQGIDLPPAARQLSEEGASPSAARAAAAGAQSAAELAGAAAAARASAAAQGGASTSISSGPPGAAVAGASPATAAVTPAPQPSPATGPASQPQQPSSAGGGGAEEKVLRLMALGFDRLQCNEALAVCEGSEERAASYLFDSGMGF